MREQLGTIGRMLVVANYHLAAALLLVAGIFKTDLVEVSELLMTLYELGVLTFDTIIFLSRVQPWFEIILGAIALSGWQAVGIARAMAALYIAFAVLIAIASQGFLLLPIDCGCFGEGEGTPVYLLLLRNGLIAALLMLMSPRHARWTLWQKFS